MYSEYSSTPVEMPGSGAKQAPGHAIGFPPSDWSKWGIDDVNRFSTEVRLQGWGTLLMANMLFNNTIPDESCHSRFPCLQLVGWRYDDVLRNSLCMIAGEAIYIDL